MEESNPLPLVISSTSKLTLSSEASFGDGMDIFQEEKVVSEGGTIIFTIDVRRPFEAGDYVMHILETDTKKESKVAILTLHELCPIKIHNRLVTSNMGEDFGASNYMNRYDWMHMRNWGNGDDKLWKERNGFVKVIMRDVFQESIQGEEEEYEFKRKFRNLVYFVNTTHISEIGAGEFRCESENNWVWKMNHSVHGVIGFIIEVKAGNGLIEGDWHYGCVLVDKNSAKCFGFVFGDFYTFLTADTYPRNESHLDIGKINYNFDKSIFQK